ncbi:hypothetical protein GO986_17315 [Deinococcus sp. HMF7620]|uniref:Uncharacterized protein n=1 Tax=Deinococcus arboris TaxID=2682977 RepID=A0A7C9MAN4_9DEIO|nr:hypothetical protein [Deinococcus arboris]MVN88503.1 hypothetical protein [Deinococcus arboris]
MSERPDRREAAATRLRGRHALSAHDGQPRPAVAVVLIGLASTAAILGLHRLDLLSGRLDTLVAGLLLTPVWIMWRVRRLAPSSDTTPPVRLPRRVRRRRGLPRDQGTLAPADPAEYWRQKRARQEQDRQALEARARQLAARYAPCPWRQWHAPAPLDELMEVPGRPGHYGVPHARDLWSWVDGDWQPLAEEAGGILSPPERGALVRVYGARFDWDERHAPVHWVEIGADGVLFPAGDARPDEDH